MRSASTIAKWMLFRAKVDGELLTNLKLQKLLHIANGWCLAFYDHAIFNEDLEAWTYGPVVPSVYNEYKQFGGHEIPVTQPKPDLDSQIESLLESVWDAYANFSAVQLVAMTHKPGTPWSETYRDGVGKGTVISTKLIQVHYRDLAKEYATSN